jgi:hypothetical protein
MRFEIKNPTDKLRNVIGYYLEYSTDPICLLCWTYLDLPRDEAAGTRLYEHVKKQHSGIQVPSYMWCNERTHEAEIDGKRRNVIPMLSGIGDTCAFCRSYTQKELPSFP